MQQTNDGLQTAMDPLKSATYALAPEILLAPSGRQNGQILMVTDGEIKFIGPREKFKNLYPDTAISELPGKAIIPGFIDAHTHVGQAFGKSLTGGEPSQIWKRIWVPLEGNHDVDSIYVSAKWMFLEALRGGITTINNFAILGPDKLASIHRAALDVGIRLVSSTGTAEPVDIESKSTGAARNKLIDEALAQAEAHIKACEVDRRLSPSICVPGVQGASGELMSALSQFCATTNTLFQIHTNEHHVEVHWSVVQYGLRPLEYFAQNNAVGPHTLHHHAALVTASEIELLKDTGSGVSYNPLASVWKGDGVAPALAFVARGVRFGIGSDSTRLDAFRLLENAEACQRHASGMQLADFSCGAAWTWVDAATRGSADVTGLGGTTGELRKGLRADFLILDMQTPEVLPSWDFEWELIRLYNRDQIVAVIVDGKPVMAGGQPIDWSASEFLENNLPLAVSRVNAAPIQIKHQPSDKHRLKSRTGAQTNDQI